MTKKNTKETVENTLKLEMLPVEKLQINADNVRTNYKGIESLGSDMEQNGQKTPLTVMKKKNNKNYVVLAGNRRLLAAQAIGMQFLACVVYPYIEDERQRDKLVIDSGNTAQLDGYDVAGAISRLKAQGYSDHEIAVTLRGILPQPKGDVAEELESLEAELAEASSDKRKITIRKKIKKALGDHFRGRIQDRTLVMRDAAASALYHKLIRGVTPDWSPEPDLPSVSLATAKKVARGDKSIKQIKREANKADASREEKAEKRRLKKARKEIVDGLKSRQFLTLLAYMEGEANVKDEQIQRLDRELQALDELAKGNGHVQKALRKALKK